jgi:hypothetical protein
VRRMTTVRGEGAADQEPHRGAPGIVIYPQCAAEARPCFQGARAAAICASSSKWKREFFLFSILKIFCTSGLAWKTLAMNSAVCSSSMPNAKWSAPRSRSPPAILAPVTPCLRNSSARCCGRASLYKRVRVAATLQTRARECVTLQTSSKTLPSDGRMGAGLASAVLRSCGLSNPTESVHFAAS